MASGDSVGNDVLSTSVESGIGSMHGILSVRIVVREARALSCEHMLLLCSSHQQECFLLSPRSRTPCDEGTKGTLEGPLKGSLQGTLKGLLTMNQEYPPPVRWRSSGPRRKAGITMKGTPVTQREECCLDPWAVCTGGMSGTGRGGWTAGRGDVCNVPTNPGPRR
ncbi:hypothetical protein NHX12_005876 [Muraenolepis orangiensis]|uniref:Uncharacterized protein n=1 Tax=Muraenolepis orangiensis TaxID=630683 RepID=A0A9Q0DSE3_9TELE|nr:hypothetical protein NHX12_005876 [Muraenolepis orangiensis]